MRTKSFDSIKFANIFRQLAIKMKNKNFDKLKFAVQVTYDLSLKLKDSMLRSRIEDHFKSCMTHNLKLHIEQPTDMIYMFICKVRQVHPNIIVDFVKQINKYVNLKVNECKTEEESND